MASLSNYSICITKKNDILKKINKIMNNIFCERIGFLKYITYYNSAKLIIEVYVMDYTIEFKNLTNNIYEFDEYYKRKILVQFLIYHLIDYNCKPLKNSDKTVHFIIKNNLINEWRFNKIKRDDVNIKSDHDNMLNMVLGTYYIDSLINILISYNNYYIRSGLQKINSKLLGSLLKLLRYNVSEVSYIIFEICHKNKINNKLLYDYLKDLRIEYFDPCTLKLYYQLYNGCKQVLISG